MSEGLIFMHVDNPGGKVPPAYDEAAGESYTQRPAVNKELDSESRDSKNSRSSLEATDCRVSQTRRSLETITDKKKSEVNQSQKLPALHKREAYTRAAGTQKVAVVPPKGKTDSNKHDFLPTVAMSRHDLQETGWLQPHAYSKVQPVPLSSKDGQFVCSGGSRLERKEHGDQTNFQGEVYSFSVSRDVIKMPKSLPSRFRFRRLSSISPNESQEKISICSGAIHQSNTNVTNNVHFNSGNSETTTSSPARTMDSTYAMLATTDEPSRLMEVSMAPHRRACTQTGSINDNSQKDVSQIESNLTGLSNCNVCHLEHTLSGTDLFSSTDSISANHNIITTEQPAYFSTGDRYQMRLGQCSSVGQDERGVGVNQSLHKGADKERTKKVNSSRGHVVTEKLLLPSLIRQGSNPFEATSCVASKTDTSVSHKKLKESCMSDPGIRLLGLEEKGKIRRPYSRELTACASKTEMYRFSKNMRTPVANLASEELHRTQQSLPRSLEDGSLSRCRNDLEIAYSQCGHGSEQENVDGNLTGSGTDGNLTGSGTDGDLTGSGSDGNLTGIGSDGNLTGSGSDVSDTLSIVTEVPEPGCHDDHFPLDFLLNSDDTFEDSRFDDDLSDDDTDNYCLRSTGVTAEQWLEESHGHAHIISHIQSKDTDTQVSSVRNYQFLDSQRSINTPAHSLQNLHDKVDPNVHHEGLTGGGNRFEHVNEDSDVPSRARRQPDLSREEQLKVSEMLANWSTHAEMSKSVNNTHALGNKINKLDRSSPLSPPIASSGKSTSSGKPTLLSLANKNQQAERAIPPQSSQANNVAAATANRTAQHCQQPYMAHWDSRTALLVPDSLSEYVKDTDSGIISGHTTQTNSPEQRVQPYRSNAGQTTIPAIAVTNTADQRSDEEDDDFEELFSKRLSDQMLGSRSSLADSRESIYSVYSDAGEGNCGGIPVTGEVMFHMCYNHTTSTLEVHIKQCRSLAPVDTKHNRSDPYVKTYLLPDKTRTSKRKTRIKKHTLNPVFDEILKYQVSSTDLLSRSLWLTVWHNDRLGRNDFLGEVTIPLDYYRFDDNSPVWFALQERVASQEPVMFYKGDLFIALKYVPADLLTGAARKQSKRVGKQRKERGRAEACLGELHVLVRAAENLTAMRGSAGSNPFCKGYLLPDTSRTSKQKTQVIRKTTCPEWQHVLVFRGVEQSQLHERGLELTVWDHDTLSSNDFLGGVRLNLGHGLHRGKPVDWMDGRGEEIAAWQSMIDQPNEWIDVELPLRASMGKQTVHE